MPIKLLKLLKLLIILSIAGATGPVPAAAPIQMPINPSQESLRLTQVLYAGILEKFMTEGESQYRPDFLLHRHYIRTFLQDWNRALENSEIRTTQEYFASVANRPTYLGRHYEIWKRIHHANEDKLSVNKKIRLGGYRETFLSRLLKSETELNINKRIMLVYEQADQLFLQSDSDTELGVKVLSAFESHPQAKVREQVQKVLRSSPRFAEIVAGLKIARNVALLFGGQPGTVAANIQKSSTELKSIGALILKIWPKELLARVPFIYKAVVGSAAVHSGIMALPKSNLNAKAVEPKDSEKNLYIDGQESPLLVIIALQNYLNTNQTKKFADFTPAPSPLSSKQDWIAKGLRFLKTPDPHFDWAQFISEGERLANYWPSETGLAADLFNEKIQIAKARVQRLPEGGIEEFRKLVIENELSDYRVDRRTLSSIFLDWGGNCVSETLMMISLLETYPKIIPSGYRLGMALLPQHAEAVLLSANNIWFLRSGKVVPRQQSVTILRPEAIILRALKTVGANIEVTDDGFYLDGGPTPNKSYGSDLRKDGGALWSSIKVAGAKIFSNEDLMTGFGQIFAFKSDGTTPSDPPAWAKNSYGKSQHVSPVTGSASRYSQKDLVDSFNQNLKPNQPTKPVEKIGLLAEISLGGPKFIVCLEPYRDSGNIPDLTKEMVCDDASNSHAKRNFSFLGKDLHWMFGKSEDPKNKDYLIIGVPLEVYKNMKILPPETWPLQTLELALRHIHTIELNLPKVQQARARHAKDLMLDDDDGKLLQKLDRFLMSGIGYDVGYESIASSLSALLGQKIELKSKSEYYVVEFYLRSMLKSYRTLHEQTSKHARLRGYNLDVLPSVSGELEIYADFIFNIFSQMESDPDVFVTRFAQWPDLTRWSLINILRRPHMISPDGSAPARTVRDYLNKLSLHKTQISENSALAGPEYCTPMQIQRPVCDDPVLCRSDIRSCESVSPIALEPSHEAMDGKAKGKNPRSSSNILNLDPTVLGELSIAVSGGVHLWNEKVRAAISSQMPALVKFGLQADLRRRGYLPSFPLADDKQVLGNHWTELYLKQHSLLLGFWPKKKEANEFTISMEDREIFRCLSDQATYSLTQSGVFRASRGRETCKTYVDKILLSKGGDLYTVVMFGDKCSLTSPQGTSYQPFSLSTPLMLGVLVKQDVIGEAVIFQESLAPQICRFPGFANQGQNIRQLYMNYK